MPQVSKLCPGCMKIITSDWPCSSCGYDGETQNESDCLPIGTKIGKYTIGCVLNRDAQGIKYIAFDGQNAVNIREYFPTGLATRSNCEVVPSESDKYNYNNGLLSFLQLYNDINDTALTSILTAIDCFEDAGTGYAVFPRPDAITLEKFLEINGNSIKWEQLRSLVLPLFESLISLSENGIHHGAISPQNLLVTRDGRLLLDNFLISGIRISDNEFGNDIDLIYSSPQQNCDTPVLDEKSDIYGFGCVIYRCLFGIDPPHAAQRLIDNRLPVSAKYAEQLPRFVLTAMANAMQCDINNRIDTFDSLRDELIYSDLKGGKKPQRIKGDEDVKINNIPSATTTGTDKNSKASQSSTKAFLISLCATLGIFLIIALIVLFTQKDRLFKKEVYNESSQYVITGDEDKIGTFDSNAVDITKKYTVPKYVGTLYADIENLENNERFNVVIKGKEYSDKYARGVICAQSVKAGQSVEKGTEIKVTISLGSKTFSMPKVTGYTQEEALISLLKLGLLYDNIQIEEKYDPNSESMLICEQSPQKGKKITAEDKVIIYVNTYVPEEEEPEYNDTGYSIDEGDFDE